MDIMKLAKIGGAFIFIAAIIGLFISNSWLALIVVFVMGIIAFLLFLKFEKTKDYVELEREALLRSCKNTKHKLVGVTLVPDPKIALKPEAYCNVTGFIEYGPDAMLISSATGRWPFKRERLLLIPNKMILNESYRKKLEGQLMVHTTGFVDVGAYEVPSTMPYKNIENLASHFAGRVSYRGAIEIMRETDKLIKTSSGLDSTFEKMMKIAKKTPFDLTQ